VTLLFKGNCPEEVLSSEGIKLVIKAINDSKNQQQQFNEERNLITRNGKHNDRWNYIFTNISNSFKHEPFKIHLVSRGELWEFVVLYNKNTNILYIILKEYRFKDIKKDKDKPYHYVKVLNSKNYRFQNGTYEQLSILPEFESVSTQVIDEKLEEMIKEIKDEVKGCINIVFRENKDGVCGISGIIANANLDILHIYDWNKYITAKIDDISDTKNGSISETPKINLPIRKDKLKKINKEIVEDKNKKEDEDKIKE
jgi:hypothetical protein